MKRNDEVKQTGANKNTGKSKYNKTRSKNHTKSTRYDTKTSRDCKRGILNDEGNAKPDYNDPNWFTINDAITSSVTSFTLNQFVGTTIDLGSFGDSKTNDSVVGTMNVPPICVLRINPSAGFGKSTLDPINQCGLKIYAALSANNAKTTQYGPEDVMLTLLALGEITSMASYVMRVIGTSGISNPRNRYWPIEVIKSMGINYDDLSKNKELYISRYNLLVNRASAIMFPTNIDYFKACAALYNDIFLDTPSPMAQCYITRPYSTWILDETSSESGSILKTHKFNSETVNLSDILDVMENQINVLLSSATLNYLYTDVLKALGNVGRFVLPTIGSDYSVTPIYSEEFLVQIENAVLVGYPVATDVSGTASFQYTIDNDVITNAGNLSIIYGPAFKSSYKFPEMRKIMNFHGEAPDVANRINAMRFRPVFRDSVAKSDPAYVREEFVAYYLPDHYIVSAEFIGGTKEIPVMNQQIVVTNRNDDTDRYLPAYATAFKRAPIIYIFENIVGSVNYAQLLGVMCQLDFYTLEDPQAIQAFRESAIYGLYSPK